ncbi:polysaccharide deacetylase [Roseburia sp. CAG:303]|nr:polysaccharide deacetylase [Roseburia sp. CAG:303]
MKHGRAACVCTILAVTMLAGGCGAKRTTDEEEKGEFTTLQQETAAEQEETTGSLPEIRQEDLQTYSNTVVTWGPGIQMAEDGRPVACIAFQEKYASLGADFLKENKKVIYLTFDEGYENGYTEKILDILKEKQVSAVFFVTMPYAREQTALMNRFVQEGHVIGNHSVTHPSQGMPSLSIEDQMLEYQELQDFIKNTYQYDMYLFRPPAGIFSEQSLAAAACFGYRTVLWSFAYADWDPERQPSTEEALKKMEGRLHNGAIYLLHAVSATNTAVLGEFIDYAREQGYEFMKYE